MSEDEAIVFPSLTTDQLRSNLHSKEELKSLSKFYSQELMLPITENAWAFLWSICGVESNFGERNIQRLELNYYPGGIYYQRSKELQFEYNKWGLQASCSYGPWQMMYMTAKEMGYNRPPGDLWSAHIQLPYVVQYFNKAKGFGASTLNHFAACYNGGFGALKKESENVQKYITKFRKIYDQNRYRML